MGHIVKEEDWGVVDLDTTARRVFVRQDWQYVWLIDDRQPDWTPEEKKAYHREVDRSVWKYWSHRIRIQARVDLSTARSARDLLRWHLAGIALTLSFDVRQVEGRGHWRVLVSKENPSKTPKERARVYPELKRIHLFSTDLLVHRARRTEDDPWREGFNVHGHEFGHTIGNTDDYDRSSPYFDDEKSIMNVGRSLRPRQLAKVCATLAKMVPGCTFVPVEYPR